MRIKQIEVRKRRDGLQVLRFGEAHRGTKRLIDIRVVPSEDLPEMFKDGEYWKGTNKEKVKAI